MSLSLKGSSSSTVAVGVWVGGLLECQQQDLLVGSGWLGHGREWQARGGMFIIGGPELSGVCDCGFCVGVFSSQCIQTDFSSFFVFQ